MIRLISTQDSPAIHRLNLQLGYQPNLEHIETQIKAIAKKADDHIFVFVDNGTVLGYVHATHMMRLTSEPFWEIVALVVDAKKRRKGIGQQLVTHLLQTIGSETRVRVRCNSKRLGAHAFYERLGFILNKEQKVFML